MKALIILIMLLLENCTILDQNNHSYFGNISLLFFTFSTKYNLKTCPQVFKNAKLNRLIFHGISESFLKKNMLGFKQVNQTVSNEIERMEIDCFRAQITRSQLNPEMLKNGSVNLLSDDVFKYLTNLSLISLKIENFRHFSSHGFKWFSNIQPNVHLHLFIYFEERYHFPDQDICLFKNFVAKHDNLIFLTDSVPKCSCTLLWIHQNIKQNKTYLKNMIDKNSYLYEDIGYFVSICSNETNEFFTRCNFQSKFNRCEQNKSINEFVYLSEYLDLLQT
ncbi:hypothetical protein BpHYR1_027021 [Brachionus plicatilis]|uniref:Uncharacterized protein n=1 Tax=Brachionus plicatilis TaxID=10195 RepID=A0A3M7PGZ8_BRAPC|nr:hypothetical protein BpHYR1_027021 [Brachionus plicatilis]